MTLQELLAASLERLGAAGLAGREDKTTAATGFWNMRKCNHDCIFHNPRDVARLETRIVVWASADGTLFPSAEERGAHDGNKSVETNLTHYGLVANGRLSLSKEFDNECDHTGCTHCQYAGMEAGCFYRWLNAPYGRPLDKRIPWPKS